MRVLMLAVMVIALPDRPDQTPRQKAPSPQMQLLGDWQLEALQFSGQNGKNAVAPNCVFRINTSDTVFLVNGRPSEGDGLTANYKIDLSRTPFAIDLMPKQRGGVMPGLLKIEGDRLILAITTNGADRPTDFNSAQMVAYYRRMVQ